MDPFIGQIIMFAGNFAPRGWALCEGQLLPISSHTALFSILGTTYGGDGRTTFKLPDLRGRAPIGNGQGPGLSPRQLGQLSGSESTVLQVANLPAHNHAASLKVSSADATQSAATADSSIATPGSLSGRTFTATQGFNAAAPDVTLNTGSVETNLTGNGAPANNMQPYQVVNYIIALQGVYPSRS
ncbi:tail fiber protein [Gilvibacter sp.]|uniref:phage tail protein n=1 Tax=Gilvibacter sp. TaxID=2729997 RepID=UPI0025C1F24C|nr:tail fiber protein [Gilvibacter sp.]NQX78659.1 phage tail protein [Gilvibacter sp.]